MVVQIEKENEIRHFINFLAMNSSTVLLNRSSFYSQAIRSPSHLPESSLCHTMPGGLGCPPIKWSEGRLLTLMDSWLSKVIWISLHSSSHSFLPKGWTRTSIVGEGCSTMHRMQVDDAQILVFEVRLPGVSAFENHLEPFESPGELLKLTLFSLTPKRFIFNCSEGEPGTSDVEGIPRWF